MLFDNYLQKNFGLRGTKRSISQLLSEETLYALGRKVVGLGARVLLDLDVVQHAAMPAGPKIVAANHPSTTDPGLLTLLVEEPMHILIHETLFKVPVFGRYLHNAGHIPVIIGNGRQAFEQAKQMLREGHTIGIFTEGSLSPLEGGFEKPRTGTARLALSAGVPIVPVGIHLDRTRLRLIETEVEGKCVVGRWYLNGPYAMTVGEPMHVAGDLEDRPYVRAASDRIMQRIINLAHASEGRMGTTPAPSPAFGWDLR